LKGTVESQGEKKGKESKVLKRKKKPFWSSLRSWKGMMEKGQKKSLEVERCKERGLEPW